MNITGIQWVGSEACGSTKDVFLKVQLSDALGTFWEAAFGRCLSACSGHTTATFSYTRCRGSAGLPRRAAQPGKRRQQTKGNRFALTTKIHGNISSAAWRPSQKKDFIRTSLS
ncbi:hypothetical protein GN956_G25814 [Arapaima gigas]